jgi:hypothetical protein
MPNRRTTGPHRAIVLSGSFFIFLGGCLRPYELKTSPPATQLSPYKVIELTSKTFTLEFNQQRIIAKGVPPPGLNLGATVQARSNCWDDLWAGCRSYLEMTLPSGKAYHYWLVQPRK